MTTLRSFALLAVLACIASLGLNDARADDQRYTMEVCRGKTACAFILDTKTGEVRYCQAIGCRVLDSQGQVAPPPVASGPPVVAPSPSQSTAIEPAPRQSEAAKPTGDTNPSPFPEAGQAAAAIQQTQTPTAATEVPPAAPAAGDDNMPSPFPYASQTTGQALHQ